MLHTPHIIHNIFKFHNIIANAIYFSFPHASKQNCKCLHCSKNYGMNVSVGNSNNDETSAILLLLPVLAPAFAQHVDYSILR
jgi:hypothetical protein